MSKIKLGSICFLAGGIIFAVIIKLYWPTVELDIRYITVGSTTHTTDTSNVNVNNPEDCQVAKDCSNSAIRVKAEVKDNKIVGRASDDCKYADFEIGIKARSTDRYILQFGAGWTVENNYYLRPGFLYKTHLLDIAIGGSALLNKSNPGAEIMIQRAFSF